MEFRTAPREVRSLVKEIRGKHYEKFHKAKIVTLMRFGKWNKWGTIQIVTKQQRQAGIEGDYILTLHGDAWPALTSKQRKALVDHELYHMAKKKSADGTTKFKLRDHDVEEFIEIVKRYGTWRPSLKALHEAMGKKTV